MPKPKLPPQGGEKWLCLGTFLMVMFSVVSIVTMIYCTVIIYKPSMEEMQSNFQGPKRCTTTLVERNITNTKDDRSICEWSSCEEWCLSKGASPCSKVYGVLREPGADVTWEGCDLEAPRFVDHVCTTLADLKPMDCKRSMYEIKNKGAKEHCRTFNELISCEMGSCKNVSKIYACTFEDYYQDLYKIWGPRELDGFCNCNQCTETNISLVVDVRVNDLQCPKSTGYCFEKGRDPSNYTAERTELCRKVDTPKIKKPVCQTCKDMCNDQLNCLSMHSRQDVAYFGVDMTRDPPEPRLDYYSCRKGNCTRVYDLKCQRTCDFKKFDFADKNLILLSGERVVMAHCRKGFINGSSVAQLPERAVQNPDWTRIAATCSNITIDRDMNTIYASDCTNGTWLEDLGPTNYSNLMKVYSESREERNRFIKNNESETLNLIPLEFDITIVNRTRIKKNNEGCVNTLAMECMKFYADFALDGANYTSRVSYDCYYDPDNDTSVVIDYKPERTMMYLLLWTVVPMAFLVISCLYMCICSKLIYTGNDGHMRILLNGKAVTGIGHVVVYKPPPKKEKKKRNVDNENNAPVAI